MYAKNDGSVATAGKTADSRERPAIYEERPVTELWCDGRAHEQQIHTKNFLQKSFSRFDSAAPQNSAN